MTVLKHGYFKGQPVSKVLLCPQSGRRHQLRLHTKHLGHPIGNRYFYTFFACIDTSRLFLRTLVETVGDATYGIEDNAPRMMLHAWQLELLFEKHEVYLEVFYFQSSYWRS